jgi:hypothetical protein
MPRLKPRQQQEGTSKKREVVQAREMEVIIPGLHAGDFKEAWLDPD